MSTVLQNSLRTIANNYADVIEGGNSYASGTSFKGIPGTHSYLEPVTTVASFTAGAGGPYSNGTVQAGTTFAAFDAIDIYKTDAPPLFVYCSAATDSRNVGAARKISGYTASTGVIATTSTWPGNITAGDTFSLLEGFKRAPDTFDLDDAAASGITAWDRYFSIHVLPGKLRGMYGNGIEYYDTEMRVKLRINKRGRNRTALDSAMENLTLFRSILSRGTSRPASALVQSLDCEATAPELTIDAQEHVVLTDIYTLTYRIVSTFA